MVKYVVCPGYVVSQNDNDRHFVSADQLMRLHKLNPKECIIADARFPETYIGREGLIQSLPNFYPRCGQEYQE